jgi:hypothetical protein
MNNLIKIQKHQNRTRELYEQKFTRSDWDLKKPEAIKWFKKCQEIAAKEIFV